MSLTGCPAGAWGPRRAAERVDGLALLWQILDGDGAYCANPRLLTVARIMPELPAHPAATLLEGLRRDHHRDRLIKGVVMDAHGRPVPEEAADLARALDALSADWDGLVGGLGPHFEAAGREMRRRAAPLAAGLDPAADLAAITGEGDRFGVAVEPSLFLPPPQNGRHGVVVDRLDGGATAHLYHGFPLDSDPSRFDISRPWLQGGAWHYAVARFLARHWPAVAADLRSRPALEATLTAALADHRDEVAWPQILAEHVGIALKALLCERAGLPETVHASFARTRGLAFFGWFRDWIGETARAPEAFVARFDGMAPTIEARQDELVAAAAGQASGPDSIAFALASGRHQPVIVVPDRWDDALVARIRLRWTSVTPVLLRESAWRGDGSRASSPAVVFGQIGHDRGVAEILGPRGLGRSPEGGDMLVSLLAPERAHRPWRIAVAVHEAEVAGDFSAERALGLHRPTARFTGGRLVLGDGPAP